MRSQVHVRLARSRQTRGCLTRAAALAALLVAWAGSGCATDHATDAIRAHWTLDPATPATEGPVQVRLALNAPDGRPITGARLRLEGHMAHPGMAPVVAPMAESAPGVYAAEVRFTMAGPWTLLASGTTAAGGRLTRTFDVGDVAPLSP